MKNPVVNEVKKVPVVEMKINMAVSSVEEAIREKVVADLKSVGVNTENVEIGMTAITTSNSYESGVFGGFDVVVKIPKKVD